MSLSLSQNFIIKSTDFVCPLNKTKDEFIDMISKLSDENDNNATFDKFDRDVLATWNLLQIAERALSNSAWPVHLARH